MRSHLHRLDKWLASDRVVWVTRHKRRAFAVVDPEYLESVLETLEILADPETAEMLEQSLRDIREVRLHSHEELEAEFG